MSPAFFSSRFLRVITLLLAVSGMLSGCTHGRFWGEKHGGQSPRFGADVSIPLGKE